MTANDQSWLTDLIRDAMFIELDSQATTEKLLARLRYTEPKMTWDESHVSMVREDYAKDPQRYERIRREANDRKERERRQFLKNLWKLDGPAIHALVKKINWDDVHAMPLMQRMILAPECRLGTALELFWLSEPSWYFDEDYQGNGPGHEAAMLGIAIVGKVLTGGFRYNDIPFRYQTEHPDAEIMTDDEIVPEECRRIPRCMLNSSYPTNIAW